MPVLDLRTHLARVPATSVPAKEILYARLATLHNLTYYARHVRRLRDRIVAKAASRLDPSTNRANGTNPGFSEGQSPMQAMAAMP